MILWPRLIAFLEISLIKIPVLKSNAQIAETSNCQEVSSFLLISVSFTRVTGSLRETGVARDPEMFGRTSRK